MAVNDNSTAAQPRDLTGLELRNRSWRMIDATNIDYAPKFIRAADPQAPVNGLIRKKEGYYRLAEDRRDGTRVLLHSYERAQLTGVRDDETGHVMLPPLEDRDTDVYVVSARKAGVRGVVFRDDMTRDTRFLERGLQRDLNLHMKERLPDEAGQKNRVVKFMNGRCGIGIFETDDGRWRVRFYKNLHSDWKAVSRFTAIESRAPQTRLAQWLSPGYDLNSFDSYKEAFHYAQRFWNIAALNLFKGRGLLGDQGGVKLSLAARVIEFFDNKRYRDWGVALPVSLAVGFLSTVVSGTPVFGALVAAGTGVGWVVGSKIVNDMIYRNWEKMAEKGDRQNADKMRPYEERNLRGHYLKAGTVNESRLRQKLDSDAIPHLRLLNHDEARMNFDDGTFVSDRNPLRDFESLSTAPFRYFGAQFDATHSDRGLLAAVYPNGLVTLTQIDPRSQVTRHYLTYRDEFNVMAAGTHKHLDPRLTDLPGKGPVHKISHHFGREFEYAGMSPRRFMGDLMHKAGDECRDLRVFGFSLPELFGVAEAETVKKRAVNGVPARQAIAAAKTAASPPVPAPAPAA